MHTPEPTDELSAVVDKALIEKRRIIGIDRRAAWVVLLLDLFVTVLGRAWWLAISAVPLYVLIWYVTRRDPDKIAVYHAYKTQHDHYQPRAHRSQRRNKRPYGFGRDFPCY